MELSFELLDISEIAVSGSRTGYTPVRYPRGKKGDAKRAQQLAGQKRRKKAKRAAALAKPVKKKKAAKKAPAKKKAVKKAPAKKKTTAPKRKPVKRGA